MMAVSILAVVHIRIVGRILVEQMVAMRIATARRVGGHDHRALQPDSRGGLQQIASALDIDVVEFLYPARMNDAGDMEKECSLCAIAELCRVITGTDVSAHDFHIRIDRQQFLLVLTGQQEAADLQLGETGGQF